MSSTLGFYSAQPINEENEYAVTIQISPNTVVNNCVFPCWRDSQCQWKFTVKPFVQFLQDSFDTLIVSGLTVMQTEGCQLSVEQDWIPISVSRGILFVMSLSTKVFDWTKHYEFDVFRVLPVVYER